MKIKRIDNSLNHSAEKILLSYLEEHKEVFESILGVTLEERVIMNGVVKDGKILDLLSDDIIIYRHVISINGVTVTSQEKKYYYDGGMSQREDLEKTFSSKTLTPSKFKECLLENKEIFNTVLEYLISIKNNFAILLHKKVVEQRMAEYERKKAGLVRELRSLQEISKVKNAHPDKQEAMKVIVKRRKKLS